MEFILRDVVRGTGLHGGFVEMAVCSDFPKGRLKINGLRRELPRASGRG